MSQEENAAQNTGNPLIDQLPDMDDDQVLRFTRGVRIRAVNEMIANPQLSQETSDRIFLKDMLSGLDSQAISKKRLLQDQKNNDNMAAVVAELLRTVDKNTAFRAPLGTENVIDIPMREVPRDIPDIPALPGEMDVCPPQLDYASFVKSQGRDVDELGKDVRHEEADDV